MEKIVHLPLIANGQFEPTPPKLYADRVARILKQVDADRVLLVSISGVYRSGKSFLLNLLLMYLKYYAQVSSLQLQFNVSLVKLRC